MTFQDIRKRYLLPLLIFFALALVFFWIVKEAWEKSPVSTDPVKRSAMAENISGDTEAEQWITVEADLLEGVAFDLYVQNPDQEGTITVTLTDEAGTTLLETRKTYQQLERDGMNRFLFPAPLEGWNGKRICLRIRTDGGIWVGYGNTVSAGKVDLSVQTGEPLLAGGEPLAGSLVMSQTGWNRLSAVRRYWPAVGILAGIYTVCMLIRDLRKAKGIRRNRDRLAEIFVKYRYLLRQLVLRDFKVKYKASFLGVLWSFLNPLLMTLVYHLVFSNLFSSQENFVVYLMTGTILFNYVSESTSLGLNSIVGNAGLITKVYMPKYIFPLSKVLSSAINLLISMIPLLVLMALSHLPFTKAILLIPVLILFMILFCTGISLILSAFTVYFRDTQFLWSVLLIMWNFFSPVFYPESIIPGSLRGIYRMNPLYQFMSFLRSITLNGTAPGPECFRMCLIASAAALGVGLLIFRRLQRKFTVYL